MSDFLLLAVDGALLTACGYAIDRRADVVRLGLLVAALIFGTSHFLSAFDALADIDAWLATHLALFSILVVVRAWRRPTWRWSSAEIEAATPGLHTTVGRVPRLWRSGGWPVRVAFVAYGWLAALTVLHPPNNWDSYVYHLTRVGFYLQQGSFDRYEAGHPHEIEFPANAETLVLWTVAFTGGDRLAGLVQWTAAVIGAVLICQAARLYGASRRTARTAALVWLTLPEIVFQATSTQNDLLASVLALAALRFAVAAVRNGRPRDFLYAGLATGLGVGTKGTFLLAGLGIFVAVAAAWIPTFRARPGPALRRGITLTAAVAAGVASLGAYWLIDNARAIGRPLGRGGDGMITVDVPTPTTFAANAVRFGARFVCDTSGFPTCEPAKWIARIVPPFNGDAGRFPDLCAATFPGTSSTDEIPHGMEEDVAWFGPLTALWVVPGSILACRSRRGAGAFAAALVTAAGLCLLVRWQPWAGRLFCVPLTLAMPAVATGWDAVRGNRPFPTGNYETFVARFAVFLLACCCVANQGKRVDRLITADAATLRTVFRPRFAPACRWWLEADRGDGPVSFFGNGTDWTYMAFLPDFSARVIRGPGDPAAVADVLETGEIVRGTARLGPGVSPPVVDGYRFETLTDDGWWAFDRITAAVSPASPAAAPTPEASAP
ncbi:MAG: glycosyltransferase family 39 protein [Planctomycetota bacterium]